MKALVYTALIWPLSSALSQPAETCATDFQIVDTHTHIFNLRHLPVKGILVSKGVPVSLASLLAKVFERATPSIADTDSGLRAGVESKALFAPEEISVEDTAEELRKEINNLVGIDSRGFRGFGESNDFCNTSVDDRLLRQLCEKSDEIDDYYEKQITNRISSLRASESSLDLEAWLRASARLSVESSARDSYRPAESLEGILDETSTDLKVYGIVAAALMDADVEHALGERAGVASAIDTVTGGLRFLRILMSSEDRVFETLKRDYCGTEHYVAYMMDMEQGYATSRSGSRNKPDIDYEQQLEIYAKIIDEDSSLSFFGAYDPFRLDPTFSRARSAISAGAIGLKFYPPSGYRVGHTTIPDRPKAWFCWLPLWQPKKCGLRKQWTSRYGRLSENRVRDIWKPTLQTETCDERCLRRLSDEEFFSLTIQKFLEYAVENEWTIFSHHTPKGFEASKGYGLEFADPCHWGTLLTRNPELQKVKLVLGHSGGNGWSSSCGWPGDPCDGSKAQIYERFWANAYNLCVTFENVYCDFGYQDGVLAESGRYALKARLEALMKLPINPQNTDYETADFCSFQGLMPARISIFDKVMYGSDWMMVAKEPEMQSMPAAFEEVLSGSLEQFRERFFHQNAKMLLLEANTNNSK